MPFQIHALDAARFAPLFALDDRALAARGARRVKADAPHAFPCRVSLAEAAVGETLILANHTHLEADTPYRASHAVFVRAGAVTARPDPGAVPEALTRRLLSLRAFDAAGMMRVAEVVEGHAAAPRLAALLASPGTEVVHIHFAAPGCFAAAATRAGVPQP